MSPLARSNKMLEDPDNVLQKGARGPCVLAAGIRLRCHTDVVFDASRMRMSKPNPAHRSAATEFKGLGQRKRRERLAEIEHLYDRHIVGGCRSGLGADWRGRQSEWRNASRKESALASLAFQDAAARPAIIAAQGHFFGADGRAFRQADVLIFFETGCREVVRIAGPHCV